MPIGDIPGEGYGFGSSITPAVVTSGVNVDFIRPELIYHMDKYRLISDCLSGSKEVKMAATAYLPMPNSTDQSVENKQRYIDYKHRAVFYNVTRRTLEGLVGEVFNVDPVIKVPTDLNSLIKDANGSGVPLAQLAQEVESWVLSMGRAGLLADFPVTDGVTSKADIMSGGVRPAITSYRTENIINWITQKRGNQEVLVLLVLREWYEKRIDRFGFERKPQYRVCYLDDNGFYVQEVWRNDLPLAGKVAVSSANNSSSTWQVFEGPYEPKDSKGNRLTFIPFVCIGSVNNDFKIDFAPLFDLADLNIAHYRNSADYEDSIYMVGQPTPVLSGLTQQWVDEILKGTVQLGSRAAIPLPEGASASLLQADPNQLAEKAMEQKERQMVALGAKLVEQKTVQRTATEADLEKSSEVSTLSTITKNVSAGFKFAIECCGIFTGSISVVGDANNDIIEFTLNTEFALSALSADELRSVIDAWIKEAITFTEMRDKLRRNGLATEKDEVAKAEIQAEALQNADNNLALGLDPTGQALPNGNSLPN